MTKLYRPLIGRMNGDYYTLRQARWRAKMVNKFARYSKMAWRKQIAALHTAMQLDAEYFAAYRAQTISGHNYDESFLACRLRWENACEEYNKATDDRRNMRHEMIDMIRKRLKYAAKIKMYGI